MKIRPIVYGADTSAGWVAIDSSPGFRRTAWRSRSHPICGQRVPSIRGRISVTDSRKKLSVNSVASQTCWKLTTITMSTTFLANSSCFRMPDTPTGSPSDADLQRADGCGRIVLSGSENGTRIEDIFERSPIRIRFPRSGNSALQEAVLINTGGGVAGGDRLECTVTALPGASLAVTSQAAEKVYRALCESATVVTRLKVRESARLAWLPQETIVFNRARLNRTTEIEVVDGAELLALEWIVLGRTAYGEIVTDGQITEHWRVKKEGRLIWADSFRINDEVFPHIYRKALLSGCTAIATLIYCGCSPEKRLEFLRNICPSLECSSASTLVGGIIVARLAASESSALKRALSRLLEQFGRELGPGPFQVPKMWSC